jgi:hypothetical protein
MRYGLLENLQEFTAYVLGGSKTPFVPYNESGDWEQWLPRYENQTTKLGDETSGCTVWASQNQLETLYRFLYNEEPNYAERFNYILAGVVPNRGGDPQSAHESIRKDGVIDNRFLPMTDSLEDFMDKSDITGSLLAQGQYWLKRHEYKHEWLWTKRPANYIEILKDALQTSPIAVSVSAWNLVGDEYVSYGDVNNHYCLLYKIEDGHPWVFDSYDHSKKKLSKDHNIRRAKRIWLNKRTPRAMRRHVSILQSIVNMLMSRKTLLDVCNSYIGKDVTPKDNTPDEVACVDTGSTILKEVYPHVPHEVSTIVMDTWLSRPENGFRRVFEPEPEAIIISPTRGSKIGHMGFVMDDDTIASNTSFGIHKGEFIKNYTYTSWRNYYQNKLGLEIHLYKKV